MKVDLKTKPPQLLKTILEIMVVILFVKMLLGILSSIYLMLFQKGEIEYDLLVYEISDFNPYTISLIIFEFALGILFLYVIYQFRNLIRQFYDQELYSPDQIKTLNCIGEALISLTIGKSLLRFFADSVMINRFKIEFEIDLYDSFWFMLSIGLFFVFLSKIFENARLLKEENDLTV